MKLNRIPIHVEACLKKGSEEDPSKISKEVVRFCAAYMFHYIPGPVIFDFDPILSQHITSLTISDFDLDQHHQFVPSWRAEPIPHVYTLHEDEQEEEMIDGKTTAATVLELPSAALEGLWESIYIPLKDKSRLLKFADTALRLSRARVRTSVVSFQRMVLLHGPPGTGKTTIAQAFAHKIAIATADHYQAAQLLTINAHSLFSRYFSESGKLVSAMFQHVRELAEDGGLVVVLVDEVESLAASRSKASSSSEPSDAIRVVNALLTQLDQLRACPNVLVVCTSNIAGTVDGAFLDRADLKMAIGLPGQVAREAVLRGSVAELFRRGVLEGTGRESLAREMELPPGRALGEGARGVCTRIRAAAEACEGVSGRGLRRLPFLALTRWEGGWPVPPLPFLAALRDTAAEESQSLRDAQTNHLDE